MSETRAIRTLDYWESRLTTIPSTIECAEMRLLTESDQEPPVFLGPGHIDIRSSTDIDFTMFATPTDAESAFRHLRCARENPYEVKHQFRLFATDFQGTTWNCGWTLPELKGLPKVGWPLVGILDSLVTHVSGSWVSPESSVELVFRPKLRLPLEKTMEIVTSVAGDAIYREYCPGQQNVHALDTEIIFFHTPADESLWVTAKTSDKLPHPHAENWLSEPLRVLLGQLVYPRLVARNFGDGTAQVWIRPSPPRFREHRITSFFKGGPLSAGNEFWNMYAGLLTLIAGSRDEKGNPNFGPHQITSFYEEIILAAQGSRWVLCLTLASVAEGLAKMLMRPTDRKSDFTDDALASLKTIIAGWEGDKTLKSRILSDISRAGERSIGRYLRDLAKRGSLEDRNERAWSSVRNAVMHGNLLSPWGTEEEDRRIFDLADLVHRLTYELICVGLTSSRDTSITTTTNGTAP